MTALGRAEADLADPESCARAVAAAETDIVVNAAAYTAVDRAEQEEAVATTVNGEAPGAIARAAAGRGLPFLHVSTDYVFDGSGDGPWTEDDPPAPLGAYGRSKLAGERAVAAAGGAHAILRTSWVHAGHGANFVRTMLRAGASRPRLTVVDDQRGGPTPASAVAATLVALAHAFANGRGVPAFSISPARRRRAGSASPARSSRGPTGCRPPSSCRSAPRTGRPRPRARRTLCSTARGSGPPTASVNPTGGPRSVPSSPS